MCCRSIYKGFAKGSYFPTNTWHLRISISFLDVPACLPACPPTHSPTHPPTHIHLPARSPAHLHTYLPTVRCASSHRIHPVFKPGMHQAFTGMHPFVHKICMCVCLHVCACVCLPQGY